MRVAPDPAVARDAGRAERGLEKGMVNVGNGS